MLTTLTGTSWGADGAKIRITVALSPVILDH